MGCLLGLAALLTLAVPASIAPASLVGAYVVLGLLAVAAAAAVVANDRRGKASATADGYARPCRQRSRALVVVGVLTVVYAGVVAVVHLATR